MSTLIPVEIFQETIIIWSCPVHQEIDGRIASEFRHFKERFMSNFAPFVGEIIHKNKKEYKVEQVTLYVDDNTNEKLTNDIKFLVDTSREVIYVDFYGYLNAINKDLLDPKNYDLSALEVPNTLKKWEETFDLMRSNDRKFNRPNSIRKISVIPDVDKSETKKGLLSLFHSK